MVWVYIIVSVLILLIFKELIRLPTVGKYGERYVFITGCDTGFGNMLAKRLDSLGFNVFAACLTERGEDELRKASSERLKTLSLDVSKIESINKAQETVEKQLPPNKGLWAIVNNAGIVGAAGPSEWLRRGDYKACLDVNVYGVIDVTRVFQPLVRKAKGRVVNTASIMGRIAAANAPYVISKYAVEAFSDCLRREVLKQGISVHILEPGYFATDLLNMDNLHKSSKKAFDQASPDVQLYYGKDYVERSMEKAKELVKQVASPKTYLVVDAYTHAITAMFPRYRYLVGNDARYVFRLFWNLPEWISDKILTKDSLLPDGAK